METIFQLKNKKLLIGIFIILVLLGVGIAIPKLTVHDLVPVDNVINLA